jgi:hypothetical protein
MSTDGGPPWLHARSVPFELGKLNAGSDEDPKDFAPMVAFVPRKLLPQLPAMAAAGEPSATMQRMEGVVSFLDLAGFTKLTERLTLQV